MIRITVPQATFTAIADAPKKIRQVIVAANMDLWNGLVEDTPEDTGFAMASWWPSLNGDPPTNPNPPQQAKGKGAVAKQEFPAAVLMDSAGKKLQIANGTAYLARLEYEGWSQQAPNGWIRINAAKYSDHIKKHLAAVMGT